MPLTPTQLNTRSYGYLSGSNLSRWLSANLLIKQDIMDANAIQDGCDLAVSQVESALINRYDIMTELAKLAPVQAIASAVIDAGAVTEIDILYAGGIYAAAPAVVLTDGGGAGATATAVIDENGILTGFTITAPGAGYTSAPTVTLTGGLAPDTRAKLCVMVTALLAIRNIMGNSQNLGDFTEKNIQWASKELDKIRAGQGNLPLNPVPVKTNPTTGKPYPYPESDARIICSTFKTLG